LALGYSLFLWGGTGHSGTAQRSRPSVDDLIGSIRHRFGSFHDRRTGKNKKYTMEDIGLSAFAVFYANNVPLVEGEGALKVNWCEVTITGKHRKTPYHNAWVTDWKITDENVAGIVATGRCRWKIENENNNTLKTRGYHLEHNFGHGKKHLSSLLAAMNMLALLTHTFLAYCDGAYRLIRAKLPTRKIFFEHIRALMHDIPFESWQAMMDFMMRGLEIGPYAPPEA
jgi:hypothetical protein